MNNIHPTAIIFDNVEIGDNNIIGAYCVIGGPLLRDDKDLCNGKIIIGNNNYFESFIYVESPHISKETRFGDSNKIFSGCFISHDVQIHNRVFITPGCVIAGTVTIQDKVNLGIGTKVIERLTIGMGARTGAGAVVIRDVLPYDTVVGNPTRSIGLNTKNLKKKVAQKSGMTKLIYILLMQLWKLFYKLIK